METNENFTEGSADGAIPEPSETAIKPDVVDIAQDTNADLASGRLHGARAGKRRWGKIARLPHETRHWLNEQLRDGKTYSEIVAALAEKGLPGFTKYDLTQWKRGGHQDWLREQERLEVLRGDLGQAFTALAAIPEPQADGLERFTEMMIGSQLMRAIQDLRHGRLSEAIEKKPELFFRIARAASDQSRDRGRRKRFDLMSQKYQDRVAEKKAEEERKNKPQTAEGLTKEQIAEIHEAMRLL